jgi:hypothetical protein
VFERGPFPPGGAGSCRKVAELGDGQFVGQIAYIIGEKAPVSIVAKGSMRII